MTPPNHPSEIDVAINMFANAVIAHFQVAVMAPKATIKNLRAVEMRLRVQRDVLLGAIDDYATDTPYKPGEVNQFIGA